MEIVEELFLLLRRDDGKAESSMSYNGYGLAAAVVTDLVLAERITLSDDKDPRVGVVSSAPTGHPALDAALARLVEKDGKRLSGLVTDRRLHVEDQVAQALSAAGVIRVEEKRALGLVPARYPVRDPEPERRVRERLRTVLAGGEPQPADATILSILQGLSLTHKVLAEEKGDLGRRDLKRRIEAVSTDVRAGAAVTQAVQAMNTAILTAAIVPAIVTTT